MRNFFVLFLFFSLACSTSKNGAGNAKEFDKSSKTYLALGDSYTIGEMVVEEMRWPNLMVNKFNENGHEFSKPQIIAKTGWRADELLTAMERVEPTEKFDLISIQIGVNNQYQGTGLNQFREDLIQIISKATALSKYGAEGIFALSIPDYSVTPFAKSKNPDKIASEIKEYNLLYQQVCKTYGIHFYDITPVSREAAKNTTLLADDKLHPSGKMYQFWVDKVGSSVISEVIK